MGNLQPRKNLVRLVEAFNQLVSSGHDIDLVIVGPGHFRADEVFKAAQPASGRIQFTGYVTDRQLAACYRCSTAFVLPSLYEGFGYPVIEAFASGLPVVTSGAGGLKEVGGDAVVVVEGRDPAAYVEALESLSDDALRREELIERGRARARTFTWQRTAEQTADVYRSLL